MGRPAYVQRAIFDGDTEVLRAAGRKGGLAAAAKRQRLVATGQVEDEMLDDALTRDIARDHLNRDLESNAHIVPFDDE